MSGNALTQPIRMLPVGGPAGVKHQRDFFPSRPRQMRAVDDFALDVLDRIAVRDAKGRRYLRRCGIGAVSGIGPGHEVVAAEARLAHHILEGDVGGAGHRDIERTARRTIRIAGGVEQHREIGALHHLVLVAVVENGEARGNVGLERELLQQPGTQRVNGLHLQPARRFQRAGE